MFGERNLITRAVRPRVKFSVAFLFVSCRLDNVKATREYPIVEEVRSMRVCFVRPPEFHIKEQIMFL